LGLTNNGRTTWGQAPIKNRRALKMEARRERLENDSASTEKLPGKSDEELPSKSQKDRSQEGRIDTVGGRGARAGGGWEAEVRQ